MTRREFLISAAATAVLGRARALTSDAVPGAVEILPKPVKMSLLDQDFVLKADAFIAVSIEPSAEQLHLAALLRNELADWHGLNLKIRHVQQIGANERAIAVKFGDSGPAESYRLTVYPNAAVITGSDFRGALYGFQSLRQLIKTKQGLLVLQGVEIEDAPAKPFRGLKLYLPGRANIPFFKRLISDFMLAQKYNTLIMELNAGMRLESHPELNSGWLELVADTNRSRLNYPPGALHGREQNSCHQDTADGTFLEKQEVLELADWVRSQGIELVPELPSFTHSYYLLSRYKELSEVPGDKWPDTYCPSNPATYELLFDVYDEYLDLLKPKLLHIGHDELFAPVGLCPRCKDRDIGERYGEDVSRIHEHLQAKGVRVAMWGDMLLPEVRGKGLQPKRAPDGWSYQVAGGLTREQVKRYVPADTLIFNWFWHKEEGLWSEEEGENNEALLDAMGYEQIFGNLDPSIQNYQARSKRRTVLGGAPSAWFATNEFNFGKNLVSDFLGCGDVLWSGRVMDPPSLAALTQSRIPEVRARFRGTLPPSATEDAIAPVPVAQAFNSRGVEPLLGLDLRELRSGSISVGRVPFDLPVVNGKMAIVVATSGIKPARLPGVTGGIKIGADATSLLFLHACARAASNQEPDRLLWDVPDSADLLGWYEIVYQDEFSETVPIRYGVNIAEWNWATRTAARDYCYGADAVALGGSGDRQITFFSFEWLNPRPGKIIREIRLKGTSGFRGADPDFSNHYGPVIKENAVILKAISVVHRRRAGAAHNAE